MDSTSSYIAEWKEVLSHVNVEDYLDVLSFNSPWSIVIREKLYSRGIRTVDAGRRVPVDIFAFGKGEPHERYMTKVNGLPYRPADRPWPYDRDGRPLTFLAQFCFVDSRDHLGALPGDVLLVFVRTVRTLFSSEAAPMIIEGEDPNCLVFEWSKLGCQRLISADDVAKVLRLRESFVFPTCYGVRYRWWDFVDEERAAAECARLLAIPPLGSGKSSLGTPLSGLVRNSGMKIGGIPFWYHPPFKPIGGRFIASFSGVSAVPGIEFPWANQQQSVTAQEMCDPRNQLCFYDGCQINIFVRSDGSIEWHADYA